MQYEQALNDNPDRWEPIEVWRVRGILKRSFDEIGPVLAEIDKGVIFHASDRRIRTRPMDEKTYEVHADFGDPKGSQTTSHVLLSKGAKAILKTYDAKLDALAARIAEMQMALDTIIRILNQCPKCGGTGKGQEIGETGFRLPCPYCLGTGQRKR
jgi:hypothetical protein